MPRPPKHRRLILPACALAAGLSWSAQAEPADSSWQPVPTGAAVSDDNPAAIERMQFGNQFQNQGLDQWCDQIPYTIPISQDMIKDLGAASLLYGGTFNGNRQFFRYPNGEVSINDQLEIKLDLGYGLNRVESADRAAGLFFGGSIDGQSLVTRPMHSSDSCQQLKRFLNPLDFKTVLPLNAKRLAAMDVGELWIIPMTFQISFEPLGGATVGKALLKDAPQSAYISIGTSRTADPTITVFRVGPKAVRLKLHLDRVQSFTAQGGAVVGAIPATDIGTPGTEVLLSRILPDVLPSTLKLVSRQLDDILGIQANISASRNSGRQVLLQYTLDPTDPAQMENLAKVIRGDLSVLRAMKSLLNVSDSNAASPVMRRELTQLEQTHDAALKMAAQLAGIDDYHTRPKSLSFSVPVVVAFSRTTTRSQDHYVMGTSEGRDIDSFKTLKQSTVNLFHFPLVGALISSSRSQGTQALLDSSPAAGAAQGKPYLIFTEEMGILRKKRSPVDNALAQVDELMASVGTSSGSSSALRLPKELLESTRAANYHKGYFDFSLVFGPQAVQKLIAASAVQVVQAFDRILSGTERDMFDLVLSKAKIGEDGGISFRTGDLDADPDYRDTDAQAKSRLLALARGLCRKATKLYQSLHAVAALAADPAKQTQALFKLASGDGPVGRDEFLKTALRLTSPGDIAGDLILHLDKDKTNSANYTVSYVLNPALFGDAALKAMSIIERGFVAPAPNSPLND